MANKKTTKGSHYLPRTYLKHFLLDNKLHMYKKGENFFNTDLKPEDRILTITGEQGLHNIGKKNNLYNPEVPGVTSDDVEKFFNELFEGDLDKVIGEIKGKIIRPED